MKIKQKQSQVKDINGIKELIKERVDMILINKSNEQVKKGKANLISNNL